MRKTQKSSNHLGLPQLPEYHCALQWQDNCQWGCSLETAVAVFILLFMGQPVYVIHDR